MAACFNLCPVPNTYSSFDGSIGTSFMTASFYLCPVPKTNPSLFGIVCTSFMAAFFPSSLCPVPHTNTIPHYIICAPINRAQQTALLFRRAITSLDGYLALCNHAVTVELYLYLALPHSPARCPLWSALERGMFARAARITINYFAAL
jgi:hypothetical protein